MSSPRFSSATALGVLLGASVCFAKSQARPARVATPYHVVKKIALSGADGWDYLTVDAPARRLYVSRSTHLSIINIDSGQVVGEIPDTPGVHGIAIDARAQRGFTSNGRTNSVAIYDLKTLKKLGEAPVGEGPDAILFEPATRRVFSFNGRGHSATTLDGTTGRVIGTIALPGRPEFAVADGAGEIYNNIEDKNEIVAINARSLKVDHVWSLAPGEEPSGLAIDLQHHRLFAVCSNRKLIVLNARNGRVVSDLTIGNGPDACVFDPSQHLVFSPNGQDGTVSVAKQIDADHYQVLGAVATQISARTMAFDSKTHHLFTIAAQQLPAAEGAPRRRGYVEGTVNVLELGQ